MDLDLDETTWPESPAEIHPSEGRTDPSTGMVWHYCPTCKEARRHTKMADFGGNSARRAVCATAHQTPWPRGLP